MSLADEVVSHFPYFVAHQTYEIVHRQRMQMKLIRKANLLAMRVHLLLFLKVDVIMRDPGLGIEGNATTNNNDDKRDLLLRKLEAL